jgi:L-glyceraldehyde 3-phosphate reductase
MLERGAESDIFTVARESGIGVVAFSVLAQGLLSSRYLEAVPESSRAARSSTQLQRDAITPALQQKARQLSEIAKARGQTLAQMAIAWTLRSPEVCTALIGASDIEQVEENADAVEKLAFTPEELQRIDAILAAA